MVAAVRSGTLMQPIDSVKPVTLRDDATLLLPAEAGELLAVDESSQILLFKTDRGVLVTTPEKLLNWALDGIDKAIRDQDETLEELIESGRDLREELIAERYATRPAE